MSGHDLSSSWTGKLDELSTLANSLLPQYLPLDRSGRTQDQVGPRLIRHYTTQGLIDEPFKVGRDAHYTQRHLLQLLALRRLMGEGLTAQALQGVLTARTDDELRALITGHSQLAVQPQPHNPALDFLHSLGQRDAFQSRLRAAPAPSSVPAAPAPPTLTPEPYTRVPLAPGLDLHVSRQARLPRTTGEQQTLSQHFLDALELLRKEKP